MKLCLIAAEPSGDRLGAGLAEALRRRLGAGVSFCGVGGPRMAVHGVASPFDIGELALVGIFDGLRVYPTVLRRVAETVRLVEAEAPDGVVLIDSWGFTIRVAERLRRRMPGLPLIKYVGPQVWASRPKRAANLARAVDHVLTLQPFEPPYFERYGLPATFVGNPTLDQTADGDGAAFRARYGLGPDVRVVLILLGSRRSEVRRLGDDFAEAAALLAARYGTGVRVVAPLAPSVALAARALAADDPRWAGVQFVDEPEHADAFAAADAAIACSGTVVTELAIAGAPSVVAYRLGALTHLVAKRIFKAPHISLVNMAAGERLIPEFVQREVTGSALAEAAARFLDAPDLAATTRARLRETIANMRAGGEGAFDRAAAAVLDVMTQAQTGGVQRPAAGQVVAARSASNATSS